MQCVWLLQRLSLVQQEEVAEGKEKTSERAKGTDERQEKKDIRKEKQAVRLNAGRHTEFDNYARWQTRRQLDIPNRHAGRRADI